MRILGFTTCLALIIWIMDHAAGISAFVDSICLAIVFGGGIAYAVAKGGINQSRDQALVNFADGAVYWGWLGLLAGAIGIAANMTDINQLGPASSIALLAVFYGYFVKWMVMAAIENNGS